MKRKFIRSFFSVFIVVVLLSFTGCPQPGGSSTPSDTTLSTDDVNNGARGTIIAGVISVIGYINLLENDAAALESQFPGLNIAEDSTTVTFTYNSVQADFDNDSSADYVISGKFVVSNNGTTITFTNFTLANAANTSETHIVNGSISLSGSDTKVVISTFSVSGSLFSSTLTISTTMSMSRGQAPVISAATINGKDYLTEFNSMVSTLSQS